MRSDVVVAGSGVAAAAVASRLIDAGYQVLLLRTPGPGIPGAEILPPEAQAQIEVLGWAGVFDDAGVAVVEGFENYWNWHDPVIKPGPFLHVERIALARSALAFVIRRGASIRDMQRLPPLGPEDEGGVLVTLDGVESRFRAGVDATGRAAAWSKPVRREGRHVADLFEGPPAPSPLCGRVVLELGGERWAYRAGLIGSTTVGVVARGASHRQLDPPLAVALGVSAEPFSFVGRRPSFPQWATEPARGRRLAVGDAAFAADPLAGQGLRFAMASANAAAVAIDALVRSDHPALALAYYRDFVNLARARHLSALVELRAGRASPAPAVRIPDVLRFIARPRLTALNVGGTLTPDVAYELPDGALVRWLGGFDLRHLCRLAHEPILTHELSLRLQAEGLSAIETKLLIESCLYHKVLG